MPQGEGGEQQAHDVRLWSCLFHILGVAEDRCDDVARNTASLPLAMGGLGLRSAVRTSPSVFWASWADCLPMVQKRHPEVAACIVERLSNQPRTPCLGAAAAAAEQLKGARPPPREPEENERNFPYWLAARGFFTYGVSVPRPVVLDNGAISRWPRSFGPVHCVSNRRQNTD